MFGGAWGGQISNHLFRFNLMTLQWFISIPLLFPFISSHICFSLMLANGNRAWYGGGIFDSGDYTSYVAPYWPSGRTEFGTLVTDSNDRVWMYGGYEFCMQPSSFILMCHQFLLLLFFFLLVLRALQLFLMLALTINAKIVSGKATNQLWMWDPPSRNWTFFSGNNHFVLWS
jgi:hypothetical protein